MLMVRYRSGYGWCGAGEMMLARPRTACWLPKGTVLVKAAWWRERDEEWGGLPKMGVAKIYIKVLAKRDSDPHAKHMMTPNVQNFVSCPPLPKLLK